MKSLAIVAIAVGSVGACLAAQDEMPAASTTAPATMPATVPATGPAAVEIPLVQSEQYLDRLLRAKPGTARPLQPVPRSEATLQQPKAPKRKPIPVDPNRPLKRDGDVVADRLGYLERTPDGQGWQYAFESARSGLADPPMIIVPSSRLAAMEDLQQREGRDVRFRVTGQISTYEGQNYLLIQSVREWPVGEAATQPADEELTAAATDADVQAPATAPALLPSDDAIAQATTSPATAPTTTPTTSPVPQAVDPDRALSELLRPRPRMARPIETPASEVTTAPVVEGVAPGIREVPLRREGEMVVQRIGRLKPDPRGGWKQFVFESDDRGLADPPMLVIPNQRVAQMEAALERAGLDLRFSVTGLITTYRGRNYLLVEKAQLVTEHEGL